MASDTPRLEPELLRRLTAERSAGERVLYAAVPDWRAEWGKLAAIFMFGLCWSAVAFTFFGLSIAAVFGFIPLNVEGEPSGIWTRLAIFAFTLPFAAIGAIALAAPFLSIATSRRTLHAVTDARLINVYAGHDMGAESYPLSAINFIKRQDRRDGTGNLAIGYGVEKDSDGDPRPLTLDWTGIPDVRHAENLIREQAKWVR